ncbi:hypothetical protein LIC_10694 [Leptospira interrogans serovar Copenhageni str. Fiocruz L1-130]|uniref:Uncharacterized protein n=1 Tax=Leptospira interrogans serogroup Icterohaemorrhagiae serovar copenhageni (strain Fiocruz L1-130) TaxID=267671 RepID=Q72UG3_LEPIC|nr:hypothetical protein LIC_10694 [Leptospira interrogans serovar Copenhageni str. Fiocruz L1-130]
MVIIPFDLLQLEIGIKRKKNKINKRNIENWSCFKFRKKPVTKKFNVIAPYGDRNKARRVPI